MTRYMTGHEVDFASVAPQRSAKTAPAVLSVAESGACRARFADISFDLRAGEILGITGLLGSGRTDLALALFGKMPADSGQVAVDGKAGQDHKHEDALASGIGYVPEDRLREGLFLSQSIGSNVVVRIMDTLVRLPGVLDRPGMENGRWTTGSIASTSGPSPPICRPAACPAEISSGWCWPSGWRASPRC